MTMNVNLSPQLEAMVKAKVASGRYTSASEVVRKALRLMERQDQPDLRQLQLLLVLHPTTAWSLPRDGDSVPLCQIQLLRETSPSSMISSVVS